MMYLKTGADFCSACIPLVVTDDLGIPKNARPLAAYEVVHLLQRSFLSDSRLGNMLAYLEYFTELRYNDYDDLADFLQAVKHRLKETGDWVCWPLALLFGRSRLSGLRDVLQKRRLPLIELGRALGLSGWRAAGAVWLWDLVGIPKRRLIDVAQVLNVPVEKLLQDEQSDVWALRRKQAV